MWELDALLIDDDGDISTCGQCTKTTGSKPDLFGEITAKNALQCLDKKCWSRKVYAYISEKITAAKEKHDNLKLGFTNNAGYSEKEEIRKVFGSNCYGQYDVETAKKSEDGAFPMMILDGKKTGSIVWRKKPKGSSRTAGSNTGTGPKTLKERRDGLNRKRWSFVNATLVKLLSGDWDVTQLKYADKVTAVMYLVSCFGIKTIAANSIEKIEAALSTKAVTSLMTDKLFEMVQGTFMYELEYTGPITQMPDEMIKMTSLVANVFQIDLKPYKAEAKIEYKEPKSWAGLKADGTPKVKK
jgi:hypothetical protein